jgi:hypothetical protein
LVVLADDSIRIEHVLKEVTKVCAIAAGAVPDLDFLVNGSAGAYGEEFSHGVTHSLALSTMMAKRHDVAGTEAWGKSVWALGRIEAYFERHQRAAQFLHLFASSRTMPINLRAQARLKWVKALADAGDNTAIATGIAEVRQLLPVVDDWSTLLDIACQLRFAPGDEADKLAFEFFEKAEPAAVAAANATLLPAEAHTILLKLARRTTQDFHKPERTVAIWDSIDSEMKLWLWSESTVYWEYLSFVLLSMLEAGKQNAANQLHSAFAADASTPRTGRLFFLITYGDWLMKRNSADQSGLAMLLKALDLDRSHTLCRKAHYWWAKHYWEAGDPASAKLHAIKVRYEPWSGSGMLEDWQMAAYCEWILADGDESKLDPKMVAKFGGEMRALIEGNP